MSRGVPVARLLLAGEVVVIAWRHLALLERAERIRLMSLLARARLRPGRLTMAERRELSWLLARLQPRLFFAAALQRVSPVPLPRRLLYGSRAGAARKALAAATKR